MCCLVEEALSAGFSVHFPLPIVCVVADNIKQLLPHLVSALAELDCHDGHPAAR